MVSITNRTDVATVLARSGLPVEMTAFVGGDFATVDPDARFFDVDDPATGVVIARFAETPAASVDAAIGNAHEAFLFWRALEPAERGRRLFAVAAAIRRDADLLARLETIDSGKPLSQARADIAASARYFEYYAGLADKIQGETIPQPSGHLRLHGPRAVRRHRPHHAVERAADPAHPGGRPEPGCRQRGRGEALRADAADYALRRAADGRRPGLPAGLCNVVLGAGHPTGEQLIAHELVRHITFTGSVAAGRQVGDGRRAAHHRRQPGTGRQVADDRLRRRRSRSRGAGRRARRRAQLRPVVLRHYAAARRPDGPGPVRRRCSRSGWPGCRWVTGSTSRTSAR